MKQMKATTSFDRNRRARVGNGNERLTGPMTRVWPLSTLMVPPSTGLRTGLVVLAALSGWPALGCEGSVTGSEWSKALVDGGVDPRDERESRGDNQVASTAPEADASASGNTTTSPDTESEQTGVFADGSPIPGDAPGTTVDGCSSGLAVTPLTKLSTVQYRNTVRDLLARVGAETVNASLAVRLAAIPDDSRGDLFRGLDTRVGLEHIEGYYNVAKTAAEAIVSDDDLLNEVATSCALEDEVTDDCVTQFVDRFGALAFRKPLSDAERADLLGLTQDASAGRDKIRAVIVGALISPRFVNHVEIDGGWDGNDATVLRLSAYEVASRISYTFWQTMPDEELFAAAEDGSLLTDSGVRAQLDRVFADPKARETLWSFWQEWLGLENFTGFELGRPGFAALTADIGVDENLYPAMTQEIRDLTEHFTFAQTSPFKALLETNVSVTKSQSLAKIYGVDAWSGEGEFPTLDSNERSGLFQRAALLVSSLEQTNPFHRGASFKRHLLCENLPPPDPAALPPGSLDIPPTSEALTTRQRFEAKVANNDLCTTCHGLFSSVGYTLEPFDAIGRYRTVERVFDEASGELLAELPVDGKAEVLIGGQRQIVNTPSELNSLMMEQGNVEACMAQQYVRFVNRREVTPGTVDACDTKELARVAAEEGLLATFRRVAELQSFFQRKVGAQ